MGRELDLKSMKQEDRHELVHGIFSTIARRIDVLTTGFSLGFSTLWRKRVVKLSGVGEGSRVLDVCTGTGELAKLLVRKVGATGSVTGADFCQEMMDVAREKISRQGNSMEFVHADARAIPLPDGSFDIYTVAFGFRNVPDMPAALREACRLLRPGGRFYCLELTTPRHKWFLPIYNLYTFKVMPWIATRVLKSETPYKYLPYSIDAFYRNEEFVDLISRSGFSRVRAYPMTMGIATIFEAVRE